MSVDGQDSLGPAPGASAGELLPVVYRELRDLAEQYLRHERAGHTLQPTALVHEAYLRLAQAKNNRFEDAGHFFRAAATVMRHILVNHARDRRRQKRGGSGELLAFEDRSVDVLALDEALEALSQLDPRQVQVVELRFFCGLSIKEIAVIVGVSERTVKDDWYTAKAWLHRALAGGGFAVASEDLKGPE